MINSINNQLNSNPTILFISYDGMTDPLGQSQVIPYLQGLSQHGYKIFLLSCEKKQVFAPNKSLVEKLLFGYDIEWVPISYTKKPPVLSTIADIYKLKRAAARIHGQYKIDMVHTRIGIPSLVGLWMKKKYGVKFLNDIREFYADSRVDGGMWNRSFFLYNQIYRYFKKQEALQVRHSDGIVCLTHAAEKIIRTWPDFRPSTPLAVIPCSADLNLFDPAKIDEKQKENIRAQLGIQPEDIIFSYLGSIGGWYLTAEMMQFCRQLSEKIPAAKFLFISPHQHNVIVDTAAAYGLPAEKLITTHARRTDVPVMLSFSSYSLFFIKPCYSKQSSSPTKHGEIMAMGIPIITNAGVGDVQAIVEKYEAGFVLDEFTPEAFAKVINKIGARPAFDKLGIRNGAIAFYALENAVSSYIKMYDTILR